MYPGRFFHVFNRGNNGDNLFYKERNYGYFLEKYFEYMSPVLDTYCYNLLPNHFHLLARVKEEAVVIGHKEASKAKERDAIPRMIRDAIPHMIRDAIPHPGNNNFRDGIPQQVRDGIPTLVRDGIPSREKEAALWVSELFRRFFLGYSQAIRNQEDRTSSLFEKNFKRLEVDSHSYFTNLVLYIHTNAQLHGLCSDFRDYPYSSYDIFSNTFETPIRRDEVLEWFGSYPAFAKAHLERVNLNLIDKVLIEEDSFVEK